MQKASEADHRLMMDQLHIASVRRGRDGTKKDSPYYANYDESKANPFPNLPDPLTLKNGKKVANAKDWWNKRRPEIVEDFDREIYGRVPKNVPKVQWAVTETTDEKLGDVPVIPKQLVGTVDNSASPRIEVKIQLTLVTPANAAAPVPVMHAVQRCRLRLRPWPWRTSGLLAAAVPRDRVGRAGAGQGLGLCHFEHGQRSAETARACARGSSAW